MFRYDPDFKRKIVDLYLSGMSSAAISREHHVTPVSVRKWVKESGQYTRQKGAPYPLDFKRMIVSLYASGMTSRQILAEHQITVHSLYKWVRDADEDIPIRYKNWSLKFKRNMVDLYLSGTSSTQISKDHGISPQNICRWVKELGEETRRPSTLLSTDGKEKTCSICGIMQPLNEYTFCPSGVADRNPWCKTCHKNIRRTKKYKLSPEKFGELLARQGGVCAICGEKPNEKGIKGWCIDHDHSCCSGTKTCGKCVRGILCQHCNKGLGCFQDNERLLQNASLYLKNYREEQNIIPETKQEELTVSPLEFSGLVLETL